MTNSKQIQQSRKTYMTIGIITAFILLFIVYILSVRKFGELLPRRNAGNRFSNNDNMTLLNKLNDTWQLPDGFVMQTIDINGLEANWIYHEDNIQSNHIILQLHGGAYTKSLEDNGITYQRMAVNYAKLSEAKVLTVNYRVAPEHPFPAALEDAVTAYQWLLDQGYNSDHIITAGDSAGGGLTLATTLYLRDNDFPLPSALITMSPWTNLNYKRFQVPYVGENDATDPYISPIYGDYTGLPPMLIQVGGDEELLKDSTSVAASAEKDGVEVKLSVYEGMFHVFQALAPTLEDANEAWEEVDEFIHSIYNKEN